MRYPTRVDLIGDRGVSLVETIARVGVDLTAAAFAAQVRLAPDASGSPLVTITAALTYGGTDTLANHIAAGRLSSDLYQIVNPSTGAKYAPADSLAVSVIQLGVDNSLMKAPTIPLPAETGDDTMLAWDLLVTPSGGLQDKWFYGSFTVRGTVTQ